MFFGATSFSQIPFGSEEQIQGTNVSVNVSTNLIVSSLDSVVIQSNPYIYLNTNLLSTAIDSVAIQSTSNPYIYLNTNLLSTAVRSVQITFPDINVNLNTNLLSSLLGTTEQESSYNVTGNSISSNIGSVSILTSTDAYLSGLNLTVSTKTPAIIAWNLVNINTTNTWSVVDIAA